MVSYTTIFSPLTVTCKNDLNFINDYDFKLITFKTSIPRKVGSMFPIVYIVKLL